MPPSSTTPQITIAEPPQREGPGVLPISAAQTNASKPVPARLKVLIRRLPPGLTQKEFQEALGSEWNVGGGRTDWLHYKPGKVSKEYGSRKYDMLLSLISNSLSKPSRPARAYLHVTEAKHLDALSDKFRQTNFEDAKKTTKDSVLLGPPMLEFAQYQRIPAGRKRNDARQGLIDQDPEFIAFLESLTNPVTKPASIDAQDSHSKPGAVNVTPLIQYLRDKKAAKEKGAQQKSAKHARQTSKAEKEDHKAEKEKKNGAATSATAGKQGHEPEEKKSGRRAKAEKAAAAAAAAAAADNNSTVKKENVKPASKTVSSTPSQPPSSAAQSSAASSQPATDGPSKRASLKPGSGVARMLQRDLGITRGAAARGRGRAGRNAEAARPAVAAVAKSAAPQAAGAGADDTPTATPDAASGQTIASASLSQPSSKANANGSPAPPASVTPPRPNNAAPAAKAAPASQATQQRQPKSNPVPAATSTQAFLKHANASQGITEKLIEAALGSFGKILKVEIDKRKGFAFVDFAEPSGLRNAMRESPIKVAQGSVQILERKERGVPNSNAASAAPAAAAPSSAAQATPAQARSFAPPSGPAAAKGGSAARSGNSGNSRGGARSGRGGGGRGGHTSRGNSNAGNSQGAEKSAPAAPVASASTGDAT